MRALERSALRRSRREFYNEYLVAKSASIQPRTNLVKFARAACTDPPGFLVDTFQENDSIHGVLEIHVSWNP